jgi:predicted Zn-dependent protease with MMP-like domain
MSEQQPFEEQEQTRNEQSARHFIALLCFLMAFLCLLIFLTQPQGGFSLIILLLVLLSVMGGILLLERGKAKKTDVPSSAEAEDEAHEAAGVVVEGTLVVQEFPAEHALEEDAAGQTCQPESQDSDQDYADEVCEEEDEELQEFKELVEQALAALPAVLVESEPDEATCARLGVKQGHLLLGCYQGTPLTEQGQSGAALPGRITLYQKSLQTYCHGDPERIRQQVQRTVLHEVAHYFGIDHEQMPHWIK